MFLRGGGAALVAPPTVIKRLRPRRCIARELSVELADAHRRPESTPSMLPAVIEKAAGRSHHIVSTNTGRLCIGQE
jgi:hypothetical protein